MNPRRTQLISVMCALVMGIIFLPAAVRAAELIMFESDVCEWCERWNEEIGAVYPNTVEGKCAPLRRLDIGDERPDYLTDVRPVRYTPTFVVVDEGREIARLVGYAGEDFFWYLLAEKLEKLPAGCPS